MYSARNRQVDIKRAIREFDKKVVVCQISCNKRVIEILRANEGRCLAG